MALKVLITDTQSAVARNFIAMYGKTYDLYVPESDEAEELTRFEGASHMFGEETYDAVVHTVDEYSADALVAFKNVQYAAVAAGVQKVIVVMRAEADGTGITEDSFTAPPPLFTADLARYMIPSLVMKDTVSTVLCVFGAYGAGMAAREPVLGILAPALGGKKPIAVPAQKTFSAIYLEDVCRIVAKFIENDYEKGVYNVAAPEPVSYDDFAKKAKAYAKKAGREVKIVKSDKAENASVANVQKLTGAIGPFRFTALGTGVNKTLDYYGKHKKELKA